MTLAVLDIEPHLSNLRAHREQWRFCLHQAARDGEPTCNLPCPEYYRQQWARPAVTGVTRCIAPDGHPLGTAHYGILVESAGTTALYQWPQSEHDLPAGDRT
jgi:hypothetical protein